MMGDKDNETLAEDETVVTVAGRLMFRNLMGKAGFAQEFRTAPDASRSTSRRTSSGKRPSPPGSVSMWATTSTCLALHAHPDR